MSRSDSSGNWAIKAAGQTDQARGMCCQLVGGDDTFTRLCVLRHTQFHEGDQPAEVLITSAVAHEDRYRADTFRRWALNAYLGAYVSLKSIFFGREMKSRRPIN